MTRRLALLCAVSFATVASPWLANADPFSDGAAAAAHGDHATAAAAFERAIAERGWSPGTLLDLGNAYAGAGERGRAILAYERGLALAPRDAALAANLTRTREEAGVTEPAPSAGRAHLARLSTDEWMWFAIGGGLTACTAAAAFAWTRRRRGLTGALVVTGLAAGALGTVAAVTVAVPRDAAVVVHADTARIAPVATAEPAFAVPEGATVEVEQRRGDLLYVRDGEREGWLPISSIERVLVDGTDRAPAHT